MLEQKLLSSYQFLADTDYLSLWDVAHRWADIDPSKSAPTTMPLLVQDILVRLMKAQIQHQLAVLTPQGVALKNWGYLSDWRKYIPVQDDWDGTEEHREELYSQFMDDIVRRHDNAISEHQEMAKSRIFDQAYLKSIYISKSGFCDWCLEFNLPLPTFWLSPESIAQRTQDHAVNKEISARLSELENEGQEVTDKLYDQVIEEVRSKKDQSETEKAKLSGKLTGSEIDDFWARLMAQQKTRILCREMAAALWKSHSDLTISDIENHEIINKYCGGIRYSDKKTIRNWIKDLDPRPSEQRTGRPKAK